MLNSTLNYEDWLAIAPDQTWLPLSNDAQNQAWDHVKPLNYSHPVAYDRAYRSQICLDLMIPWLQEEQDTSAPVAPWSPTGDSQNLPEIWEFVEGVALQIGDTRIVLIPSSAINPDEFVVPQEWVNIPNWAAHYYFAVYLNEADNYLHIAGYTTHARLMESATLNIDDQTYRLPIRHLISDLNLFWVAQELAQPAALAVPALPSLSANQVQVFIQELSQIRDYSPRLDLPFEQWAYLLNQPQNLHELYQLRITPTPNPVEGAIVYLGNQLEQLGRRLTKVIDDSLTMGIAGPELAIAKGTPRGNQTTPSLFFEIEQAILELHFQLSLESDEIPDSSGIDIQIDCRCIAGSLRDDVQIQVFSIDPLASQEYLILEDDFNQTGSSSLSLFEQPQAQFKVTIQYHQSQMSQTFRVIVDDNYPVIQQIGEPTQDTDLL